MVLEDTSTRYLIPPSSPFLSVLLIKLRFLNINMSIEIEKSCSGRAGVGR
jgi:hypothetical protein